MLTKLRILKFWCFAIGLIAWNTLKGNTWNMAYIDLHLGDDGNGKPLRKQLIAKRSCRGMDIYWQGVD